MNTLRINKYFLIIVLIALFGTTNILSKTVIQDDKTVKELASTLKQKLLLSNDQETKVINILTELQNNISSKPENKSVFIKDADTKIANILDSKQKMKYDVIKNDLWKKI